MKSTWFFLFIFLLTPFLSSAQIIITEIMYNLEGRDSGREWIEVTNSGAESIDLSLWKFYENETNHRLTLFQGDTNLNPGESAIIADNPEKFLIDWPSFSGTLFNSSFSLKNTGELISLRNSDLIDIDSVGYTSNWGGDGNGNSIQRLDSSWSGFPPNPGQHDFDKKVVVSIPKTQPQKSITNVPKKVTKDNNNSPPVSNLKEEEKKDQIAATVLSDNEPSDSESVTKVFEEENEGFLNKWFLMVSGIVVLSILSVVFVKRDNTVEGYRIIE